MVAMVKAESGFVVKQSGPRTLLQDYGRYGYHHLGMTTGGPADPFAFKWANRLCKNELNTTALEISVGGLILESSVVAKIAICGANTPLTINGNTCSLWRSHQVKPGDIIELGFATEGVIAYLAVAGGFQVAESFGSTATVVREGIGGLNGGKLEPKDFLACGGDGATTITSDGNGSQSSNNQCLKLPKGYRPVYGHHAMLRVIPGYQQHEFSRYQQRRFFGNEYTISAQSDRMGYRLEGPAIQADIDGILSEGICLGAIQVPPDGQPIILMNDRQTIGGYPKIGSVLSLDLGQLAQLKPGDDVYFEPITVDDAHNILHLADSYFNKIEPIFC